MTDIRRALDYPYDIPETSFIVCDGQVLPWADRADLSGRTRVLACGSNQSPTQLARKFPTGTIYVMAGWLSDYDTVYSAHFTSYGSVAATYHESPGMRSRQMMTWLDETQLDVMHESEALGVNYEYAAMDHIVFQSDCGQTLTSAMNYRSLWGPYHMEASPVAIKSIQADQRKYPAFDQEELQAYICKELSFTGDLNQFVTENVQDITLRQSRTRLLSHMVK